VDDSQLVSTGCSVWAVLYVLCVCVHLCCLCVVCVSTLRTCHVSSKYVLSCPEVFVIHFL
jgi:hypothetical protein